MNKLEGWDKSTLLFVEGQWRIYTNQQKAFVPLEKASEQLVKSCPGALEKLTELDSQPF